MQDWTAMKSSGSAGRLGIGFLGMLKSTFDSLHVRDFARVDHLLDVSPLLHVLLVLNPLHHSNHQLLQILLLLSHVLRRFHHLDRVDSNVNHVQGLVESCLSTSPVVHMSQSNAKPVVGLSNRPA